MHVCVRVQAGMCATIPVHTCGSTHMCTDTHVRVHMSMPTCVCVRAPGAARAWEPRVSACVSMCQQSHMFYSLHERVGTCYSWTICVVARAGMFRGTHAMRVVELHVHTLWGLCMCATACHYMCTHVTAWCCVCTDVTVCSCVHTHVAGWYGACRCCTWLRVSVCGA